jgi:hypothetical protein
MPVTKAGLREACISRNLRIRPALQIGRMEVLEDIVDADLSADVMLEFHNSASFGR